MRSILAELFRLLFKIPFFKSRFFGFHKHLFAPKNLFKNVIKTAVFKNNIRLELHIEDWIQENIFFLNSYEDAELQYIASVLKKDNTFVDIGANIGVHSLFASSLLGKNGCVIAFEPFSKNYKSLKKNIFLNQGLNIVVENTAISDKNKKIKLYYNQEESNLGMASSFAKDYTKVETIDAVTLDNYVQQERLKNIHFIKLDIEGGEYLALLGMQGLLKTNSPKLLIEILEENPSSNEIQIIGFLEGLGYQRFFIGDNGKLSDTEMNPKRRNFVFLKTRKNTPAF